MNLPKDPAILLSYVNTQLRDNYNSIDDFCLSLNVEKAYIDDSLRKIDYEYDKSVNQFV